MTSAETGPGPVEPPRVEDLTCGPDARLSVALSEGQVQAVRAALLSAMREWSEEHYAAGWLFGLAARLHRAGGGWETLGRLVGWPLGIEGSLGWVSWDEAADIFRDPTSEAVRRG